MANSSDPLFTERFAEVCGTNEPASIQRLLGISYQAAKNYLDGRLPDTRVLRRIAERTPYSIHWLITGIGQKLISRTLPEDTPVLAGQIKALIRQECMEVVNKLLAEREGESKIVVLNPENIRSEKVNATEAFSNAKD